MVYAVIAAVLAALIFLARFYRLKRALRGIAGQLREFGSGRVEKKLDLDWYDSDLEQLAVEANRQIDLTKQAVADKRRTEHELKQAISNISHDIRTPMTAILGYVQLLESEELDADQRAEYVGIVKHGAFRLKTLLEEFFELSVIESADYPMKPQTVRLNQAILEVLAGFYEEFHQRGIEPVIALPEDEIRLFADLSAVKRVIENLLINALRHSSGNVTIQLTKSPASVELTIRNPAPRLQQEELAFLFDRFYKGDKNRSGKGAGLGLSIAKSLMLKMKGQLSARLRDGQLEMRCEWQDLTIPSVENE